MASSVKTPEVAVEISLRRPDTGFVCDHQGRVHRNNGVLLSGFRVNPSENLVRPLQAVELPLNQLAAVPLERRETAKLPVPTEIHTHEAIHRDLIHSTGSPTAIRPG